MKKKLFAFALLLILSFSLLAQTPNDCTVNLKFPLYTEIAIDPNKSYAKDPLPADCKDVIYKWDQDGACSLYNACIYPTASLKYDVYYPVRLNQGPPLPAVIFFHGGGLAECPDKDQYLIQKICSTFAERGFVVFNVEYRRGRTKDPRNELYASAQHQLAVYRALQDCRGAIRTIIKRQQEQNGQSPPMPYRIDLDNIFVGGVSAGGLMSVMNTWYSNDMIYQSFPVPPGNKTIQDVLGPVDVDYYYGGFDINYKSHIKGVVSFWGAVPIPYIWRQQSNEQGFFIQPGIQATLKPVISFHGVQDPIFPYEENQQIILSPPPMPGEQLNFNTQNGCLLDAPYSVDPNPNTFELISASSLNIYNIAKILDNELLMELYVDCEGGHGLGISDFGIGTTNEDDVTVYLVVRAAIFCQAVMQGLTVAQTGPGKFTECVNFRIKCNTYSGSCNSTDLCPAP